MQFPVFRPIMSLQIMSKMSTFPLEQHRNDGSKAPPPTRPLLETAIHRRIIGIRLHCQRSSLRRPIWRSSPKSISTRIHIEIIVLHREHRNQKHLRFSDRRMDSNQCINREGESAQIRHSESPQTIIRFNENHRIRLNA